MGKSVKLPIIDFISFLLFMTLIFEHHLKLDNITDSTTNNNIDVKPVTSLTALFNSLVKTDNALSKAQLKLAISKGALWLTRGKHTQRLRRFKRAMKKGDELHFYYNQAVLDSEVADAILISDEVDYSVWYKPFGMLSQLHHNPICTAVFPS